MPLLFGLEVQEGLLNDEFSLLFNLQVNGRTGPTGAHVQYHAAAERRQEPVIVYRYPTTIILVWDLQRKFTAVLDTSAQVSDISVL